MEPAALATLLGLGTGIVLGLAARLGQFCTFGAIESAYLGNDQRRIRLWGLVLGTAIVTIYGLDFLGQFNISDTSYHRINWNPIGSIIGGLLFGYGMGLAGNCGFGALAKLAGGDLRSLVILIVMALASYFILSGPLAGLRIILFPVKISTGNEGIPYLIEYFFGIAPIIFALIIGLLFFIWALLYAPLRQDITMIIWSVLAGLSITAAFWGNYSLNISSLNEIPIQSHTFTAPLGKTLLYMMTSSSSTLSFPIGSVFGVIAGAFIGSKIKGHFRWEACDDARELGRQMLGAVLMGFGSVIAMGCSIGQGVSAFSTLAISGPTTLAAIIIGSIIAIRQILTGYQP